MTAAKKHYSPMPMEIKHSIIIPKYSPLMTLLVDHHLHKKVNHMGISATLNSLRQCGFWLIGAVSAVSQYLRKCVTCGRSRGQLGAQKMADLPIDRLSESPPFTYCGVDLFGPFIIKERRSRVKRYGVLFTCMASRAIHLESVNSLETNSFINALRRFLSIRGPVYQMRSDQGTNFVGAINEFSKVQNFLRDRQCRWILNVPSANSRQVIYIAEVDGGGSSLWPISFGIGGVTSISALFKPDKRGTSLEGIFV
ncbi:uncharacterized protein [Antedon mediterranea]|uniref:uncharacterized protein n=1 Tax=Antedon mediterranea TaxID=105859 RepID=UPI003AF57E7A